MYLFGHISERGMSFLPCQGYKDHLPLTAWSRCIPAGLGGLREEIQFGNGFYTCAVVALDLEVSNYEDWSQVLKDYGYSRLPTEDATRLMTEFGAWPRHSPLGAAYHPEFSDLWGYGKVVIYPSTWSTA